MKISVYGSNQEMEKLSNPTVFTPTSENKNFFPDFQEAKIGISIIIPAYNERERIKPVLKEVCNYISLNSLPWNVIVSLDGNDGTEGIITEMIKEFPFLSYNKGEKRSGKGEAIKRGVNTASGKFIVLLDADGAISFESVIDKLKWIKEYDFINFDRYRMKENKIPNLRRLVSRGYNLYVKLLLGLKINDTQSGYKIINTDLAKKLFGKITITNGFFYAPMFYYLKKFKKTVLEVSVPYIHAQGSKFKVSSMVFGGFLTTLFFRLINSPLRKIIPTAFINMYYRIFRWN